MIDPQRRGTKSLPTACPPGLPALFLSPRHPRGGLDVRVVSASNTRPPTPSGLAFDPTAWGATWPLCSAPPRRRCVRLWPDLPNVNTQCAYGPPMAGDREVRTETCSPQFPNMTSVPGWITFVTHQRAAPVKRLAHRKVAGSRAAAAPAPQGSPAGIRGCVASAGLRRCARIQHHCYHITEKLLKPK